MRTKMLVGLAPGVSKTSQFALRFAENGFQVLVPLIVSRNDTFSGITGIGFTNEPHREWNYGMAFEVGRHVIGYEIQKELAAVAWFAEENTKFGLARHDNGAWWDAKHLNQAYQ